MPSAQQLWKHRLTDKDYWRLYDEQEGRCRICQREDERLVVDHDHACCPSNNDTRSNSRNCGRCTRGLLCYRCNVLVGHLERSGGGVVTRAVDYLLGDNAVGSVSGMDGSSMLTADARASGMRWRHYCALYGLTTAKSDTLPEPIDIAAVRERRRKSA